MTCIAALREAGKVYFAADSLVTMASNQAQQNRSAKIEKIGPVLIGFAGSVRQSQVVTQSVGFRDLGRDEGVEEYVFTLCEAFRTALAKTKSIEDKDGRQECDISALLSVGGRLFVISYDFSFVEVTEKYQAIGSGVDYALGSLKSTTGDPRKRVMEAVKTAAHFDPGVGGRIITLEG